MHGASPQTSAPAPGQRPKVLVVDDDPDARALLRRYSEDLGFCVVEAADGNEGVERLLRDRPDVVFMDAAMPGMDGFAACTEFQRHPEAVGVPIVMTTARDDDAAIERAFACGVSEVLSKPVRRPVFRNRLRLLYNHRAAERALQESEARYRELVDLSPEMVVILIAGRIVYLNQAGVAFLGGGERRAFAGRRLTEFVADDDGDRVRAYLEATAAGEAPGLFETGLVRADDSRMQVEMVATAHTYYGHPAILAFVRDVADRRRVERELRLAGQVFDNTIEGIMITDADNRILTVNQAFTRVTGYSAADAVGQTPALLRSGRHDAAFYREMWSILMEKGEWQGEIWNRRKSGEVYPEWLNVSVVRDEHGRVTNHIALFSDITAIKQTEERLHRLAHFDPLTRLPNRMLFLDRLEQAIAHAERTGERFAVLFLDLDRFKVINDSLGHGAGDRLLEAVAGRLKTRLRESDTVARLGGDEFTVLARNITDAEDVAHLARDLIRVFEQPFPLEGEALRVTTSIGIALYPENGRETEALTKRADIAMYQAKEAGRNNFQYYRQNGDKDAASALVVERELRAALADGQLAVVYQPAYAADGSIRTVEALLRWHHPERGTIFPIEFLPVAEESGLVLEIGEWVLAAACKQAQAWNAGRPEPVAVTVNLSRRELLDARLYARVDAALTGSGLEPGLLELEVTENIILADLERATENIHCLKALGVRVAIDDFGRGYASLSYLKTLPVDGIKIDREFIRQLEHESKDQIIAESVIAMAHNLRLKVVAGGVETRGQLDFLTEHQCDAAQGFYLQRPMPAEALLALLRGETV